MRVKVFASSHLSLFQKEINDFLIECEKNNIVVKDIQFSDSDNSFSAMVVYYKKDI